MYRIGVDLGGTNIVAGVVDEYYRIVGKGKMPEIDQEAAEKSMARTEAIIYSMTPEERRNPSLMNPSRKNRIAKGAGVDIAEVNRLVKQFEQMKKMMKPKALRSLIHKKVQRIQKRILLKMQKSRIML